MDLRETRAECQKCIEAIKRVFCKRFNGYDKDTIPTSILRSMVGFDADDAFFSTSPPGTNLPPGLVAKDRANILQIVYARNVMRNNAARCLNGFRPLTSSDRDLIRALLKLDETIESIGVNADEFMRLFIKKHSFTI